MSRIRVSIGQLVLHHPEMTSVEGAMLGRMVENHLARLMSTSNALAAKNAAAVSVNVPLNAGKGAASNETAMAIARGIHQSLNGKG